MKRIIALLLCMTLLITSNISLDAENTDNEKYYTIYVEFSDNIGSVEHLNVMVNDNHVFANARELATRLGYQISDDGECVTIYNTKNNNLPYSFTQFFYDDTRINHMLFSCMQENYEAPFKSIHNEEGIWIPMEYSLLILNSSMLIVDNTVLIDMPEKRITDLYMDIMKNNSTYLFDWGQDFGYTNAEVNVIGGSSHIVNQFNGILEFDGDAWLQLFQSLVMDSSAYDSKYGENLAMLLCTESYGELEQIKKQVEKYQDIFSKKGRIGKLLSSYSKTVDTDVDAMYKACSNTLKNVEKGNSKMAIYNRAYAALEKAFDKQTWFSKTGGQILDIQGDVSDALPILDVGAKIAEVVQYGQEFTNQDNFSVEALECFLKNSAESVSITEVMKQSMKNYSKKLKSNLLEYSTRRLFEENIDDLVRDAIPLGGQADMILYAWDLASNYVPFVSNKLGSAEQFELALYSSLLQSDGFMNYQSFRNSVFENESGITTENLYELSQYCYIYLKSCYITRSAAIASLNGKREETKEYLQPLIDYQNSINSDIAEILVQLKNAKSSNDDLVYGFLLEDNKVYLKKYSDEKLVEFCENTLKEEVNAKKLTYEWNGNILNMCIPSAWSECEVVTLKNEERIFIDIAYQDCLVASVYMSENSYYITQMSTWNSYDTRVINQNDENVAFVTLLNAEWRNKPEDFGFPHSKEICEKYKNLFNYLDIFLTSISVEYVDGNVGENNQIEEILHKLSEIYANVGDVYLEDVTGNILKARVRMDAQDSAISTVIRELEVDMEAKVVKEMAPATESVIKTYKLE